MRTMIGADEALDLVRDHAQPLAPVEAEAARALGMVLAEAALADRDYPPFDRASMDGVAVTETAAGRRLDVSGESRPGLAPVASPGAASCVEIMTGAACPPGTFAVIPKEDLRRDGPAVVIPASVAAGQHIVRAGAECRARAVVLPPGTVLTPHTLGLLAAIGKLRVVVRPRPRLSLIVTGDELVTPERAPGPFEIRDSNGPMLLAMAHAAGLSDARLRVARDSLGSFAQALASSSDADIVVLTGGVSAGNYDAVPQALAEHGATAVFHKVRQQPGKPLLFAVKGGRLFFGLPGTPLGCHLGFFRYVRAAIRALAGHAEEPRPSHGRLTKAWRATGDRRQFVLARVAGEPGAWEVTPLGARGSSDLFSAWSADAYVDAGEGPRQIDAGSEISFRWLSESP
jgi:molybdopterin molybdotransferase